MWFMPSVCSVELKVKKYIYHACVQDQYSDTMRGSPVVLQTPNHLLHGSIVVAVDVCMFVHLCFFSFFSDQGEKKESNHWCWRRWP